MAAIQSISIKGTADRTSPKPHTVYEIHIRASIRSWSMWRRYSEFVDLNDELTKSTGDSLPAPLPPKHVWTLRSSFHNAPIIEERKKGLETYLRAIIASKDSQWRDHYAFRQFIGIPVGKNAPPTSAASGLDKNAGETNARRFTPATWIDEHTDLHTLVRDTRASLNKRDALWDAGDMRASSSANVSAKRQFVDLVERVGVLAKEVLGEPEMSQGEMQRRMDMVARLQDDCEKLGKIVAAARQNVRPRPASAFIESNVNPGDRAALLSSGSGSPPDRARPVTRIFGAPQPQYRETTETRPLDDRGLLQLQKQKVEQQDQQLNNLSAVLQRQMHIGVAIHTEIGEQNKILDELNSDVDRVQGKIGTAKRIMNKLN
jgi:regulator of vacuolar morphogenesis